MSYNVDSITTPHLDATMSAQDIITLYEEYDDELAEDNFLDDMLDDAQVAIDAGDPHRLIRLPNLNWRGDSSGSLFKTTLIDIIAPHIKGEVEAILCWEGGDSVTGLLIRDGKAVECEVEQRLIKPEGWDGV